MASTRNVNIQSSFVLFLDFHVLSTLYIYYIYIYINFLNWIKKIKKRISSYLRYLCAWLQAWWEMRTCTPHRHMGDVPDSRWMRCGVLASCCLMMGNKWRVRWAIWHPLWLIFLFKNCDLCIVNTHFHLRGLFFVKPPQKEVRLIQYQLVYLVCNHFFAECQHYIRQLYTLRVIYIYIYILYYTDYLHHRSDIFSHVSKNVLY